MHNTSPVPCPCCSGTDYEQCCGRFISGITFPSTPLELMRSRYTAYTQTNIEYIMQTMKSPALDGFDAAASQEWARAVNWLGLKILQAVTDHNRGWVEFDAHFSYRGKEDHIHERSEFHLIQEHWFYVSGVHPSPSLAPSNPGREPLPLR